MNLILLLAFLATATSQTNQQSLCTQMCQAQFERPPIVSQQGVPGKRGRIGAKGERGLKGSKGENGDPNYDQVEEIISQRLEAALQALPGKLTELLNAIQETDRKVNQLKNVTDGLSSLSDSVLLIMRYLKLEEISGRLYYFGDTNKNWQDARQECMSMGGDLVAKGVRESQTNNKLRQLVVSKGRHYWIGLSDIETEGRYEFVDGVIGLTSDSYWMSGEPNNSGGHEDCMHFNLHSGGKVNDVSCTFNSAALCEMEYA